MKRILAIVLAALMMLSVAACGNIGAVRKLGQGMVKPGTDGYDITPTANAAFSVLVASGGNYGTVGSQTNGVGGTCADSNDICPEFHITLTVAVQTSGNNGAVSF